MAVGESMVTPPFDLSRGLFVYGSLMSERVLATVLRLSKSSPDLPQFIPATLHDYVRYKVLWAAFPAIIPREGHQVAGMLIYLKNHAQVQFLDTYESGLYSRDEVDVVITSDGSIRKAYAYVWDEGLEELAAEEWNFDAYLTERGGRQ